MSGGSFNYMYERILDNYYNEMQDCEMNDLIMDLCAVLHDLEWWQSGDYSEDEYRKSVEDFKKKWISGQGNDDARIKRIKTHVLEAVKKELDKI